MLNALFLDPRASGGVDTYLRGLAPALHRMRPEMRIEIATTRRGARALEDAGWAEWATILVFRCDEGQRLQRQWAEQVALPVTARRRGVDLVHSLASVGPVWTPRLRHVVTLHDVTFFREQTFGRVTTAGFKAVMRAAARDADAGLVVTGVARDDIADVLGLRREALTVVHHGRTPVGPRAAVADGSSSRARLGVGPGRLVVCVGAKRPHKNQELLLDALPFLAPDVEVVLVGHPELYETQLRAQADRAGVADRVRFLDYVPDEDLDALWAIAACAAFPTRAEGFGLPILEAMERGVPIACSDLPVLREVAGEIPHYFSPTDPRACATAITAALDDHGRLDAGRRRAASFTWASAAAATLATYEQAMGTAARLGWGSGLVS